MGKKISFIKGLAVGAILAGVAQVAMTIKGDDQKSNELTKLAKKVKKSVDHHVATVGKMSKSAYEKIVDTTMAELEDVKDLSKGELKDLKKELKGGWNSVKSLLE